MYINKQTITRKYKKETKILQKKFNSVTNTHYIRVALKMY